MRSRVKRAARIWTVTIAAGVVTAWSLAAPAYDVRCPAMAGAALDLERIDARTRLEWIHTHLDATATRARWWTWGWGLGIGTAGVASAVPVFFVPRAERIDWYTSVATAAFGVLPFALAPLKVMRDADDLGEEIARLPAAADVCSVLADAEWRLVRDARNQAQQQRWYAHAGNLAFNTGVALFLGFGFHHWAAGLENGISGALVGEAIIATQPTGSEADLKRYQAGDLPADKVARSTLSYHVPF